MIGYVDVAGHVTIPRNVAQRKVNGLTPGTVWLQGIVSQVVSSPLAAVLRECLWAGAAQSPSVPVELRWRRSWDWDT